jgi:hypothetical protein
MASSIAIPPSSANAVSVATTGALTGDGTSGSKLAVAVDGATIDVSGSDQLEVIAAPGGVASASITTAGLVGKTITVTNGFITGFA